MTAESIIKINVDDSKFKKFTEAFQKYKDALANLPSAWSKVTDATTKYVNNTQKNFKNLNNSVKQFTSTLGGGANILKNMALASASIAKNFASSALSIAKWVAYGAFGGGFGLGALAAHTSTLRKQAQGLGVTTGDLRAANTNFGKYIDSESTLNRIADIQSDLSRRQILTRLGGSEGQNAAEMLPELIRSAIKQFNAGGQTQQYAEALGLTQVFSLEELRRLASLTEQELEQTIQEFNKDRKALAVSDKDSKTMQDFWIQLKRSGEQLEVTFIKALSPIVGQLTALSAAVVNAISAFLQSEEVKQALQDFINWIGSDEAKSAIKNFISGLSTIAKYLVSFVSWFSSEKKILSDNPLGLIGTLSKKFSLSGQTQQYAETLGLGEVLSRNKNNIDKKSEPISGKIIPLSERFNNSGNLRSWRGVPTVDSGTSSGSFAQFSTKEEGLRALAKQLQLYHNRDNLNTISQIISKYSPSNENNTAQAIANISRISGYGANEKLNLNDRETLSKLVSAITKQENSQSNYTPTAVNQVLVANAAGADLVVTANAMR